MEDPETTIREKNWKVEILRTGRNTSVSVYCIYNTRGTLIGVGHNLESAVKDALVDW